MQRVLYASPLIEHPPCGGPQLRVENSIKALSQVSDLYVYCRVPLRDIGGKDGLSFYQQHCKGFYFAPHVQTGKYIRFMKRAGNFAARKIVKRAIFNTRRTTEDFGHLLKVADDIQSDVIWLGYGNISYRLLKYVQLHSSYKTVVDTDSVWSQFVLRGLNYANCESLRLQIEKEGHEKEAEERDWCNFADVVTAVSEVDASYYRKIVKCQKQLHIFSNVIDSENYQLPPLAPKDLKKPCIYLAGTFDTHSPMEDAARWTIREVIPLLRQQFPSIHFYIVGKRSDQILSDINDPSITIVGKVPSVLPYLCHIDVAIVPLRFESGTRFKILEAGACGIPVVSTTLGAEGLSVTHQKDILLADEPEPFADSIGALLSNHELARQIGQNLRTLVYEKYSLPNLVKEGQEILDYLSGNSRP